MVAPPWASLSTADRRGLSLDRVLAALFDAGRRGADPPLEAEWSWPGARHPRDGGRLDQNRSAVLVALFEEAGETRVILTRRSSQLRTHTGQVSFPGGRIEPGERAVDAALREASEEVALDPREVRPSSWLRPVRTLTNRSLILPVVGALARRPSLEANPSEVARVFDVSLAELVADGAFRQGQWSARRADAPSEAAPPGAGVPVWLFAVAGEVVWGATARILTELAILSLRLPLPN